MILVSKNVKSYGRVSLFSMMILLGNDRKSLSLFVDGRGILSAFGRQSERFLILVTTERTRTGLRRALAGSKIDRWGFGRYMGTIPHFRTMMPKPKRSPQSH
eukprot:scaffold3632_cov162-Amphora_coffeaeformis.AAC.6